MFNSFKRNGKENLGALKSDSEQLPCYLSAKMLFDNFCRIKAQHSFTVQTGPVQSRPFCIPSPGLRGLIIRSRILQ